MSKGLKPEDKCGIIATCHYDKKEAKTDLCVQKLIRWTLINGYKIHWANTWGDSIPQSRERLVAQLSEHKIRRIETSEPGEYDLVLDISKASFKPSWILFIDADNTFEPEWLEVLIRHNVDIVGALYVSRNEVPVPVVTYLTNGRVYPIIAGLKEEGLMEADGIGMGFTLIRSYVLERVPWPWFKYEGISPGRWLSEDLYFCTKAKGLGFKVFVDCSLKGGHVVKLVRTIKDYKLVQAEVMKNSEENLRANKGKYNLTDEQIDRILGGEKVEKDTKSPKLDISVAFKSPSN